MSSYRPLSLLVLACALALAGVAACAVGGPEEDTQLNPQPLPPATPPESTDDRTNQNENPSPVTSSSSSGGTSGSSGSMSAAPDGGATDASDAGSDR